MGETRMSSARLDPVVAGKLKHFGRRRLGLIVARGICAGIITLLLCMALVAAIDWYWLLSDTGTLGAQQRRVSRGCLRCLAHLSATIGPSAWQGSNRLAIRECGT